MARKSIALAELARLVSPERLGPYTTEMGIGDGAVELYEWNLRVSAALFEAIGIVEVVLRNAMDRALTARHVERGAPGHWYDAGWLDAKGQQDLAVARQRATDNGQKPELPGKIVAELSFGFWRFLLAKRYQTTAWPALQKAFPLHPDGASVARRDIDDRVQRIHVLRNKIAHHEPLLRRRLEAEFNEMVDLVGWVSADAGAWLLGISRVVAVTAERPTPE